MSKITAINKIIEFRRDLYYRIHHPDLDSNLPIDEVSEMLDDIQKELEELYLRWDALSEQLY